MSKRLNVKSVRGRGREIKRVFNPNNDENETVAGLVISIDIDEHSTSQPNGLFVSKILLFQ